MDEAMQLTLRAAKLEPRNVEYQYGAARQLQEVGDFAGSIHYLRRVAFLAPDYRDARFLLAHALDSTGDWTEAESIYRQLLERQPENARARAFYRSIGARELNPHWLVWDDIGRL